jgi:hypothetical protein
VRFSPYREDLKLMIPITDHAIAAAAIGAIASIARNVFGQAGQATTSSTPSLDATKIAVESLSILQASRSLEINVETWALLAVTAPRAENIDL